MNRRSFLQSLASTAAAVAILPVVKQTPAVQAQPSPEPEWEWVEEELELELDGPWVSARLEGVYVLAEEYEDERCDLYFCPRYSKTPPEYELPKQCLACGLCGDARQVYCSQDPG